MKISTKSYCGSCLVDYAPVEIVNYVPIDNDTFCDECMDRIDAKSEKRLRVEDTQIKVLAQSLVSKYAELHGALATKEMVDELHDHY